MSKRITVFCVVALFVLAGVSQVGFARRLPVVQQKPPVQKEIPRWDLIAADVETLYGPVYFEEGLPEGWEYIDGKCELHWHATTYGAYDTHSYFCGVETPTRSGYYSYWSDWLDSPEISIPEGTSSLTMTILHKVDTEDPVQPYWDGSAVFVSVDGGLWEIALPDGGYAWPDSLRAWECSGMENSAYERLEGLGGWAGMGDDWFTSTFDLSAYAGASTIKIRYAFVSDWGLDSYFTEFDGCWVESIELTADGQQIFFDDAEDPQMVANGSCPGHNCTETGDNLAIGQKFYDPFPPIITEPYPPTGWTPGDMSLVCRDVKYLNSIIRTDWIPLRDEGYPRVSFFILAEMPGFDWANDGDLDDYQHVEIEASSQPGIWTELYYSSGGGDNDSTWEYWWWDRDSHLKVHDYNGDSIRIQWRINTDGYEELGDPADPEACQWEPNCTGRGYFVDQFTVVWLGTPSNDLAITRIDVPWLVSIGHPSRVVVELSNIGTTDIPSAVTFMFLLDPETLEPIPGYEAGIPMGPPYPYVPALDTFYFEYDWVPEELDTVRFKAKYLMIDEIPEDNELFTSAVGIWPEFTGQIGYTYRFSTGGSGGAIQEGVGPAVRFTVPEEFPQGVCIDAIRPDYMGSPLTPIMVYVKGPGPNDSTWGDDLIEPFLATGDTTGQGGRMVFDLTQRPDYENLCGITGDFWIHFRDTEQTNFSFVTRDAEDGDCAEDADRRNWFYYLDLPLVYEEDCWDINVVINFAPAGCIGIRGDANEDGTINVLDVLKVVNDILGIDACTGDALCTCDCNADGTINVLDALGIVNQILGIADCAPATCKTTLTPEVMEFLKSLESYLSAEDFARFMALVKAEVGVPAEYSLAQNYPNPFNPVTSISYSVAAAVHTTLKVYNVLGQEVVTLVDEAKEPGSYTASWDAAEMASGVYFYRLVAGEYSATRRMVLLK